MATFRHTGDVGVYGEKFVSGMVARGYDPDFAQRCFRQIEGFGSYGFPESHAISFAKLVYVSAWIKHHHPDVFCAALLNSQPMGFYQPAQLVRDAREHGVEVRPVDILASDWDCTLEPVPPQKGTVAKLPNSPVIRAVANAVKRGPGTQATATGASVREPQRRWRGPWSRVLASPGQGRVRYGPG